MLAPGNSFLWDLRFSPDGTLLAGADHLGLATVWDVERGGIRMRCRGGSGRMTCLRFTSGGQLITLCTTHEDDEFSKRLQVWETTNGRQLDAHLDLVESTRFAMTPDGQQVICGKRGGLWRFPLAPPKHRLRGSFQTGVSFLGDRFLVSPVSESEVSRSTNSGRIKNDSSSARPVGFRGARMGSLALRWCK